MPERLTTKAVGEDLLRRLSRPSRQLADVKITNLLCVQVKFTLEVPSGAWFFKPFDSRAPRIFRGGGELELCVKPPTETAQTALHSPRTITLT